MDFVLGFVAPLLLMFLAGVGVGTFVVGSLIRRIAAEVKAELAKERLAALTVVTELENKARAIIKAL